MTDIKIKPLEWEQSILPTRKCASGVREYAVIPLSEGFLLTFSREHIGAYAEEHKAKEAAQIHHEHLVRLMLDI